jgi:hypothetical protein
MRCHAEIVQGPMEWGREQDGGLVFAPGMKNPVMLTRLMDSEVGEVAAGVPAGGQVEVQAAAGELAITAAAFPVEEALLWPRR